MKFKEITVHYHAPMTIQAHLRSNPLYFSHSHSTVVPHYTSLLLVL